MRSSWWWTTLFLLILGCSATPEEAPAQDRSSGADEVQDTRTYRATLTDEWNDQPFVITNVVLFVPEVSLFGGGDGEEVKELSLRRGSAEIEVPFHRILRITVGDLEQDRLHVTLEVRNESGSGTSSLEGTVKSTLELRGTFQDSGLASVVKVREARTVEL